MSLIPQELQYTKEHEWIVRSEDSLVRFGITDYAQAALGDIVYIQLPKVGDQVVAGSVCGEVESTKSVSEIFAPVSGKVVAVNEALNNQPEIINKAPYSEGWIAQVEITAEGPLLTADEYRDLVGE